MPGPPPKPTLIKVAEGNRGKKIGAAALDEKLASEPKPDRGFPEMPAGLEGDAAEAWNFLTQQLIVMEMDHMVDALALECACSAFGTYRKAQREIKRKGLFTKASTGWMQQSAAVAVAANARKEYLSFCNHFGLTPAARARLSVGGQDDEMTKIEEALSKPRNRTA